MEPFKIEEMKTQIVSLQSEVERLQAELQVREELLQNLVSFVYSEMGRSGNPINIERKINEVEPSTPICTEKLG
jgi:TolA-binding protein